MDLKIGKLEPISCWSCEKPPTSEKRHQKCSSCSTAIYCGIDCQRKDWPKHKKVCKNLKAEQQKAAAKKSAKVQQSKFPPKPIPDAKKAAFSQEAKGRVLPKLKKTTIEFESGDYYIGKSQNGIPHGTGKIIYPGGRVYAGNWINGRPHGHGKVTHPNQFVYEGNWENGTMSGKGTATFFEDGIPVKTHKGKWKNGQPEGWGRATDTAGRSYTGSWKEGRFIGKVIISSHLGVYEGDSIDGCPHGIGTMTFKDGRIYKGEWRNGEPNGEGKCTFPDKTIHEGNFEDGELTGKGKVIDGDGFTYEGDCLNGRAHGRGKMTFPDGGFYEGECQNGKKHGQGKQVQLSPLGKIVCIGRWVNGNTDKTMSTIAIVPDK